MPYVDGFVIPVPKANREAYMQLAKQAHAIFKEHGALKLVECWGDDVPEGKVTSFPMAVKREPDETVVYSWIVGPRAPHATKDPKRRWPTRASNGWDPCPSTVNE